MHARTRARTHTHTHLLHSSEYRTKAMMVFNSHLLELCWVYACQIIRTVFLSSSGLVAPLPSHRSSARYCVFVWFRNGVFSLRA